MKNPENYINRRVEVATLTEEEKTKLKRLEESSDALWADLKEADYAYKKITDLLPTKTTEAGNEVSLSWKELEDLQKSGSLSEVMESAIRTKLQEQYSGRELEKRMRNAGRKLKRLLEKGLSAYAESEKKII